MSGHKSKTQITTFFFNILLINIAGIAVKIGDGENINMTSIFFLKIFNIPKKKDEKKNEI